MNLGGAYGPLVNIWRSRIDKQYFQHWYLEKHRCSTSIMLHKSFNDINDEIKHKSNGYQSNIVIQQINEKLLQNQIKLIYGLLDIATASSTSSRQSPIDENDSVFDQISSLPVPEAIDNSKSKQKITIREYYSSKDILSDLASRSLSSPCQQTINDNELDQFIHNQSEFSVDLTPITIRQSNPDNVNYKQSTSIRDLVPPTPPPPGLLIIRGINRVYTFQCISNF